MEILTRALARFPGIFGALAVLLLPLAQTEATVLFDNGPFSGPQSNLRNTAETGFTQRIFDDFTLLNDAEITGFEWLQHDRNDIQYLNTEIRIYDGLPISTNLIFTTNVVATRTPNATGTIFGLWDGFDYSTSGLSVNLSAGTYFLGLNTNSLIGDTSWDDTTGNASTIPGRYVVNAFNPEPGLFNAFADSVFKVIGNVIPDSVEVSIDIKPGSDPNSINCRHNGVIPVAILTTSDFDATTVDPSTVGFGPSAASATHVDGDGDMDMVLHFRQQDTGIACGDEEACLTGETTDGTAIEGCDAIRTVGGDKAAAFGTLEKFAGDGQTVQSGSAYSLVARALDDQSDPEAGVFVFVDLTTPVSFCSSPSAPTDSNGLAMISCTGAVVAVPTPVTILTRDSEGRVASPPFSVVIVPPAPVPSGLQKKSGDGQVVAENTSFPASLVVTHFISTVPQEGASLSVSTSPSGVASCVVAGLVNSQGLGTINCSALSVAETTVVQISVSDSLGQSLAHPFNATVTDSSTPVSGLTKVSGDNQTLLQNTAFAMPLVVSKRLGGVPQSGVQVNVSTLPSGVLSCTNSTFTDFNGLASISCSALSVGSITTAQIFVSDDQGDSLDQPFSATILPFVSTVEGLTKVSGDGQIAP